MRLRISVVLLVFFSPVALAKPAPIELPTAFVKAGNLNAGSVASVQGRMRQREYTEATQPPINAFPCRIEPVLFSKVGLAQSCR